MPGTKIRQLQSLVFYTPNTFILGINLVHSRKMVIILFGMALKGGAATLLLLLLLLLLLGSAAFPGGRRVTSLESQFGGMDGDATLESWNTDQVVSSHGRGDAALKVDISVWDVMYRAAYLAVLFQPIVWTIPLAMASTVFRNLVWFNLLSTIVSHSGAVFIKWGQWASTRPGMFPEELCIALSQLHAHGKAHSFAHTEAMVQMELGAAVDSVFEVFDRKPVASGSIAQVYKVRYRDQDVAVKVRHPGVSEQIEIDFTIMKACALSRVFLA